MAKEEKKEEEFKKFDYQHSDSFKLSDKFKNRFYTQTAGGPTISADGLVAIAHTKGIWKLETHVVQYPSQENANMCICEATVGGYEWDPIENKVIRVEYTDIGDASPSNCKGPVAASFIRMASTRATSRALRKYTNIDMLCYEELGEEDIAADSMQAGVTMINQNQFIEMKGIIVQKGITQEIFVDMLKKTFNIEDLNALTEAQANQMIQILKDYVVPTN